MSKELKIGGNFGKDFQQIFVGDEPTNIFINNEGKIKSANFDSDVDGSVKIKADGKIRLHSSESRAGIIDTDDPGAENPIGKFQYKIKNVGYFTSVQANYLPMNGYVIERTSTASQNEHIAFVAPYDGTLDKFIFRSEIAQDGLMSLRIYESSDGTEVPGSSVFRKDLTVDIADDTTLEYDMSSPSVGSFPASFSKGRIYAFYLSTPTASSDTNVTISLKWDITS